MTREVTPHMLRRCLAFTIVAALVAPAIAPAATAARKYAGTTDQGKDMTLTTKGRTLFSYRVPYDAKCESGDTLSYTLTLSNGTVSITSSGAFVDRYKSKKTKNTNILAFTQRTAGTVKSASAKGTHRTQVTVTDASGTVLDRCDTGIVTWELKRSD